MLTKYQVLNISHVLSLKGKVKLKSKFRAFEIEGRYAPQALAYMRRGFESDPKFESKGISRRLHTFIVNLKYGYTSAQEFSRLMSRLRDDNLRHGTCFSILTGWEDHAITFSFVKESDSIHIIMCNRGEPAEDEDKMDERKKPFLSKSVQVFTVPANMLTLIEKVYDTSKGGVRASFAELLSSTLYPYRNRELSEYLTKSFQKVGNCTIANQNITWHLALAGEKMRANPTLSFRQAYTDTRDSYHELRETTRIKELKLLLSSKEDFAFGWKRMVKESLDKLMERTEKNKQYYNIDRVVDALSSDPIAIAGIKAHLQDRKSKYELSLESYKESREDILKMTDMHESIERHVLLEESYKSMLNKIFKIDTVLYKIDKLQSTVKEANGNAAPIINKVSPKVPNKIAPAVDKISPKVPSKKVVPAVDKVPPKVPDKKPETNILRRLVRYFGIDKKPSVSGNVAEASAPVKHQRPK